MSARVRTGLDRLAAGDAEVVARVRGRRVGLLAHPASVDAALRPARAVLEAAGAQLVALFGPEHGYGGEAQDMVGVEAGADLSGLVVHSLYGDRFEDLAPRREWLEGLDVVVVDLQDVGSRYYTYIWTAALMLREAARAGVETLVLDRPNPLGGEVIEGAPQRAELCSFVGLYPVPVRHGLTLGEVCLRVQRLEGLAPECLTVVCMLGWQRSMAFDATGLPWVLPSPNMPTLDTAFVYPGGCLLEGTNLSEGRGTTRPFEIFGAPFVDAEALVAAVQVAGVTLRPLGFQPTFQKHTPSQCFGVQVHVHDRAALRSFELYARMIAAIAAQGRGFGWRTETYEFVDDRPAIDLLAGDPAFREAVESGGSLEAFFEAQQSGAAAFASEREPDLLYP